MEYLKTKANNVQFRDSGTVNSHDHHVTIMQHYLMLIPWCHSMKLIDSAIDLMSLVVLVITIDANLMK